jgi:CubicO group peptidase (beta-lactamase class C family)
MSPDEPRTDEPSPADARIAKAISDDVFSGAALVCGDAGRVRWRRSFGHTARVPATGVPVTPETWFDLASLTKVIATTAVAMRLCERGQLELDRPVLATLPELAAGDAAARAGKDAITARHLLAHSAGLHWWQPLYQRLWAGDLAGAADARSALLRMAAAEPLDAAPGTRAVYTDFGFILLGALRERLGGARLDALAHDLVWTPLGMTRTRFVDLAATWRPAPVVATETCPRRGLLAGEVHDENAHAAGGISGHAGVFAIADDVSRFAAAVARSWHGEHFAGAFAPDVVRDFARPSGVPGSTRCLGWDSPSPGRGTSQAGDRWPREHAIGHMGFTGTSLWLDLPQKRWVVLLTNRVHPSRSDERIKQVRPAVHDDLVQALDAAA